MLRGECGLGYPRMLLNIFTLICSFLAFQGTQFAWVSSAASDISSPIALPNCTDKCGNVSVPYPFGIGDGCYYIDPDDYAFYNFTCDNATLIFGNIEVTQITLDGEFWVKNSVAYVCYNGDSSSWASIRINKFTISTMKNSLVAIGCDTYVWFNGTGINSTDPLPSGCMTLCNKKQAESTLSGTNQSDTCSFGVGCCKAFLPDQMATINVSANSYNNHQGVLDFNPCSVAFVVANDAMPPTRDLLSKDSTFFANLEYPIVYSWSIGITADEESLCKGHSLYLRLPGQNSYTCRCQDGFQGNPYLNDCQDIDECAQGIHDCEKPATCFNTNGSFYCLCPQGYSGSGTRSYPCLTIDPNRVRFRNNLLIGLSLSLGSVLLLLVGWWLHSVIKRKQVIKQRAKYFKRNGGLLLLQQQSCSNEENVQRMKIFKIDELEKATDQFNEDRILGKGGQGTVYKGMLGEGKLVAIKKSHNEVKENQLEEFINEVVILLGISHRNIVKLLGCCLETEVPILVYEFIPNGTLYHHIHNPSEEFTITWKMRLLIATDAASALAHLHSSSTTLIFHRDIKSSNILLDDKYRAKLSDFGTSRSVAIDQTRIISRVVGTLGYLDPEYLQSNQYTEKSDVYSFGVVLVELITGQKAIRATTSQENDITSLTKWFLSHMVENSCLFDVVDPQVLQEGSEEEFRAIASVAKQCLNLDGNSRPTMKEVLKALEAVTNEPRSRPKSELLSAGIAENLYYDGVLSRTTFSLDNSSSSSVEASLLFNPR